MPKMESPTEVPSERFWRRLLPLNADTFEQPKPAVKLSGALAALLADLRCCRKVASMNDLILSARNGK